MLEDPPPGPFRPGFWRSPLRGPWLTAFLGWMVLAGFLVAIVTGFLSHAAYEPDLGRNAIVPADSDLPLTFFDWPTSPWWLYAVTQGLHVHIGIATIPILIAKLWSVMPRLFAWPPARTPAEAIERGAIGMLVASSVFLMITGVINIQNWYPFGFNFVVAHYYLAVIFVAALGIHLVIKVPIARRAFRTRGALTPLLDDLAHTTPEPPDEHGLVPSDPDPPTTTRRGVIAFAGAGSLLLLVSSAGQSIGGPVRDLAFLGPRRKVLDDGPNGFPVNKRFDGSGIAMDAVGPDWRLTVRGAGGDERTLTREDLLALDLVEEELPIACVEGWTTLQTWQGVRLADLGRQVGMADPGSLRVVSLQPRAVLGEATLNAGQVADPRSLLALRVNGADLSLDHGFPARIIVPALPGVHNTKWVSTLEYRA